MRERPFCPQVQEAFEGYATTSIPMGRAVPLMLLIAVSTEAAFRSGVFCVAISRTCFSLNWLDRCLGRVKSE